jgi:hypothetical protein
MPEFRPESIMATTEIVFEKLVELGCEITRQIAEAEAEGNRLRVNLLLGEKDKINRTRKEITHAVC